MIVQAQAELLKDYGHVTQEERCYRVSFTPESKKNRKLVPVRKLNRKQAKKLIKFELNSGLIQCITPTWFDIATPMRSFDKPYRLYLLV